MSTTSTSSASSSPSLLRHLVWDNPMTLEATRVWRRFLRSGGDTGKGVNITAIAVIVVLYVWLLIAIVRFHEEMSSMLLVLEALLLTLLVPGSMYAAISGERERLTWDSLIMTSLSPGQIVVGKLLWRIVLILGIAVLFLPPLLLSHYIAPVLGQGHQDYTLQDLFLAQGLNIAWGGLLAGFSLLVSTRTKRTVTTLAIVTITLLSFLFLVPALLSLFGGHSAWRPEDAPLVQLGALLKHLHPLDGLMLLQRHGYDTNPQIADLWLQTNAVSLVPWIYLGGAIACIVGAWKTLKGLEEPRVRS